MKKLMWSGWIIQLTMTIIIILIAIFQHPIPDFVVDLCVGGMATCIISSFFVRRNEVLKDNLAVRHTPVTHHIQNRY